MATLAPGDFKNTSKKKASSGPYSGKSFQKIAKLFFEMIMSIIFWFFGFTLVLTPFVTF